jgi:signal transduction histidine kinase
MPAGSPPDELVYVGSDPEGEAVERIRAGLPSASVTAVADSAALEDRLGPEVNCVVVRHDLPDGTGFDAHDAVKQSRTTAPVVLLAEPTGRVAARAVEADLHGFVPLSNGRPSEQFVGTVERALRDGREAVGVPADEGEAARWKADILDQLFARVPIHIYVKDANARHVLVSTAHVEDQSSVVGRSDLDSRMVPKEEGRAGYEDDLTVLETGDPIIDREEYYPSRDEWYLTSKVPRYDQTGDIVGLIGVSREITERKKAQERLESLNERLEQFVSVVSHDLRNPLTVARGRVEHERAERDSEHLAATERALARMNSLIDDLLTLANADDDIQRTDHLCLSTLARSCWEDVPTDGATLTVDADLEFEGASGRVRQLFENLFRNAIEHGSAGEQPAADADGDRSTVGVTVGALPSADGFYVADDGPGIPEEERDTVFESGYTTRKSGTGFGLSIVEDVARAHRWTVAVEASETGGARFEVRGLESVE